MAEDAVRVQSRTTSRPTLNSQGGKIDHRLTAFQRGRAVSPFAS
jgi:hypothetical protein